jgi:hypothetical protein
MSEPKVLGRSDFVASIGWIGATPFSTRAATDSTIIPDVLKEAEDSIALFLNGGPCSQSNHPSATELQELLMLKQLRLKYPHQSTQINEIERAIERLRRGK